MKPIFRYFYILLCSLLPCVGTISCRNNDSNISVITIPYKGKNLNELNKALERSAFYTAEKTQKADSLKQLLKQSADATTQTSILRHLAIHYRQLDSDSSIYYATLAIRALPQDATKEEKAFSNLTLVNALSTAGIFAEARQILKSIDPDELDDSFKAEYWRSQRMHYSYSMAFMQKENDYTDIYMRRYMESDDSLLKLLPHEDPFRTFIMAERLVGMKKWEAAKKNLQILLDSYPLESNIFGMSAFQMAEIYKNQNDFNNYIDYLALSAVSDVKGAVKEGMALPTLATVLYEQGDIENAFRYIRIALDEARNGNVRMRTVSIVDNMAAIDHAYQEQINESRHHMVAYLIISLALLLVACILSGVLIHNVRNSRIKERKLETSSRTLQAYVGNFIGLCSNYASRLDQMARLVIRKTNAGQTDELVKLMGSGRFMEENNEEFYKLIDKAILDIYPDFVESINAFLLPDKQIHLPADSEETLNPELRIYAFVRLGVEQSSRIAQILNYSVNTVYSYRNRMRNRAINRDTFDEDIAALDRGSEGSRTSKKS